MGSGRGSSSARRVLLSATFEHIACSQVVRRLRSSTASSNARFPSRRLAPKPVVTDAVHTQQAAGPRWLTTSFASRIGNAVAREAANCRQSCFGFVRQTGSSRSRSGGAFGHVQHIRMQESDTHQKTGSSLQLTRTAT